MLFCPRFRKFYFSNSPPCKTSALQSHSFAKLIKPTPPHRLKIADIWILLSTSRVYVKLRNRADSKCLLQPTNRRIDVVIEASGAFYIVDSHKLVSVWSVRESNSELAPAAPIVSRLVQSLTDSLCKLLPRCLQSTTNYENISCVHRFIDTCNAPLLSTKKLQPHDLLQTFFKKYP